MTTHENSQTSAFFRELTVEECQMLLKSKGIGRIVWCGANGPQALPVNYVVDIDAILFRTSPHSAIASIARGQEQVAFEVDDIDEFIEAGWSVLVVGKAEWIDDPDDIPHKLDDQPAPWAPGVRSMYIRIHPATVTGRRVIAD
jgi:uncharacterized protein